MPDKIRIIIFKDNRQLKVEYPLEAYIESKENGQSSVIDAIVNAMLEKFKN